ncbi:MAG: ATP-dependent helicase HrpB [Mailhella sp.]|nr:ATP-dependent helicase HrpB [Mailhella sp.]
MEMPVESSFPALLEALTSHERALLTAPPGSGKTTRVPLFLMEHMEGTILMLEPRRLAARSAARYMAAQLGESAGQRVGYRVRLESRVSRETRVEIITEGILTRRLISDPELSGVSCVIFDEFHERSLQADTGLALCLEAQQALRPDLKILVMSATLDSDHISELLAPCPVIRAEGRSYPVALRHAPCPASGGIGTFEGRQALLAHCAATVRRALAEESGSALVFLPGQAEIRRVAELLEGRLPAGTSLHPLYGDLSAAEQDAAIAPAAPGLRKVVLATSIAETSLTIEGIRIVVDSGLSRTARFSPATGMSALVTERVTQDAADQRAGRAGRIEEGTCWRLWHEGDALLPCRRPEILEADLAPFLLDVLAWGSLPQDLPFLTPAPEASTAQALHTLRLLGAVHEKNDRPQLTPHGEKLARLPLHPRLAHMVLSAGEHSPLAAALAALTEERSSGPGCDLRPRLGELRRNARLRRAAEQVYSLAVPQGRFPLEEALRDEDFCGPLLSLAWPERIAQRRERGSFRLASGRGALLPQEDALADAPFLAVASMDGGSSGTGRIHLAAPLGRGELEALHAGRLRREDGVLWDERTESVLARRRLLLDSLVLEDAPLRGNELSPDAVTQAVLEGIARLGLACLPWSEELRQWQARVLLMRRMEGEDSEWPDVSDSALLAALREEGTECWLAPWLNGISRRTQFAHIELAKALHTLLPYASARRLDREAPTHLSVPSGSDVRIDYLSEGGPVLAVKLQEMFGQQESPTVCSGRCAVTVHLLSPAGRPLQVTRDLAGFWRTGYAAVRAEMRGRYPKHPWPEDPLTAIATKKTNKALARG